MKQRTPSPKKGEDDKKETGARPTSPMRVGSWRNASIPMNDPNSVF